MTFGAIADKLAEEADVLERDLGPGTAEFLRVNRSTVFRDVRAELDTVAAELRETTIELRAIEAQRLDMMQAGIFVRAIQGDPAAIRTVLDIMTRRARLFGLDAPDKVTDVPPGDFGDLDDSQLQRIARGDPEGGPHVF